MSNEQMSEQGARSELGSASKRLAGERDFIDNAQAEMKEEKAGILRQKIKQIDQEIAQMQASIESMVAKTMAANKVGGAEKLKVQLEKETHLAKKELLQEMANLKMEKKTLEEKIDSF